jgi:AcrR family transcriptional regulator
MRDARKAGLAPAERRHRRQYKPGEERREEILAATLEILAEEGLHAWTTRALASRIGVSEATIFRHFESKEEILTEAVRQQIRAMRQRAETYEGTGDAWERASGLVLHILDFVESTGGAPLIVLTGQAVRIQPSLRQEAMKTIGTIRGKLTALFAEAVAKARPRREVDPSVLADLAIAVGQSTGLRWLISGRRHPLKRRAAEMLRALRHSVGE